MTTPGLIINVDPASLTSTELKNAFAILSNLPSLKEFNNVKEVLNLTIPDVLGPTTLSTFLRFCINSEFDLSSEGVRRFKANNPPLNPDLPILGETAKVYYKKLGFEEDAGDDCPWMEIAKAELAARVREFPGDADNPRIVEYHKTTTLPMPFKNDDETAWCSSFVNWCLMKADIKRTKNAMARSWENWGTKLTTPRYGCIVVFWRISRTDGRGHVGFFIEERDDEIVVLGGNQGDAVTIESFPKNGRTRRGTPMGFLSYRGLKPEDRMG
jgi:uncharacterized protein (TIGR02594 family)